MTVSEYFTSVERSLRRCAANAAMGEPFLCLASDEYNGLLRCRGIISESAYLDIYELARTELGYPVRVHYFYAFVRDGTLAFRYDNAPHHRELATHPHHLHIGPLQRVSPADQPTLGQVPRQVESLLKT